MHPGIFTSQDLPVTSEPFSQLFLSLSLPLSRPSFLSFSRCLPLSRSSRNVIVFAAGPVLGVTDLPERVAPGLSSMSDQVPGPGMKR